MAPITCQISGNPEAGMELTVSHISRRKELLTYTASVSGNGIGRELLTALLQRKLHICKTQRVPAQFYLLFISTHSSNGIIGDCSYKCSGFSEWLVILTPLLAGSNKRG